MQDQTASLKRQREQLEKQLAELSKAETTLHEVAQQSEEAPLVDTDSDHNQCRPKKKQKTRSFKSIFGTPGTDIVNPKYHKIHSGLKVRLQSVVALQTSDVANNKLICRTGSHTPVHTHMPVHTH